MMTHFCAGKILMQENIAPVVGYVHLVHIYMAGTSRNPLYVKIEDYAKNEVRLTYD